MAIFPLLFLPSSEHFTYMATPQLSPFHVMRLSMTLTIFHGHLTDSHQISQKRCAIWQSYYRLLVGNHTLAFDWCHLLWPWSAFDGHFRPGRHVHVHLSNLWPTFASRCLPAVAELVAIACSRPICCWWFALVQHFRPLYNSLQQFARIV